MGEKIKYYIESHGIKQAFIANKAGMTLSNLNESLNGKRKFTVDEYFGVCTALGLPVDYFYEEEEA